MDVATETMLARWVEQSGDTIGRLGRLVESLIADRSRFDAELAEIRDGMIELDHKIARLAIREAHTELRDLRGHHDPAA